MEGSKTSHIPERRTPEHNHPETTNIPSYYQDVTQMDRDADMEGESEDVGDSELTETVLPPPARKEDRRRPSWEETIHRPSRHELHEGDRENMELTEMNLPPPARPQGRRDSLEAAMQRVSSSRSRRKSRDAALGEVAAAGPAEKPSDEETAVGSPSQRKSLEDQEKGAAEREHRPSPFVMELVTVSALIFFSLLGTLARLGVEAITLYPNTPVSSRVLWANLGGSFFMGFLAEDRRLFRQEWGSPDPKAPASNHGKVKKTIPLYIGLATGFCGSFTSFSSFIRDCFLAMTNDLQGPSPTSPYHVENTVPSRNGGFSFLALMAILILHPAVSLAALNTGAQLALLLQPLTPTIPIRVTRSFFDPLMILLGFGCWLGAVFLAIWPAGNDVHWRFRAVFPLVFAPPGCLLRFYASKHLNAIVPSFPLGYHGRLLRMSNNRQYLGGRDKWAAQKTRMDIWLDERMDRSGVDGNYNGQYGVDCWIQDPGLQLMMICSIKYLVVSENTIIYSFLKTLEHDLEISHAKEANQPLRQQ